MLDQLLKAGFNVTVLTRQGSTHKFPENVTVKEVDYESLEALTEVLGGQDAVVSTLGAPALAKQLRLVEAAAAAKVQRFIPSEFGSNTSQSAKVAQFPVFADKITVQEALKKEAAASRLTYTLVHNGAMLDWGLRINWIANVKEKSITLHDGGNRVFSASTLPAIGQAVAGVLKHPEETKNRTVFIQSIATTLKNISEVGQKATGAPWKESVVSIDDQLNEAWAELKKPSPDPNVFVMKFIHASIWGEGYGSHFEKNDNELLGIKEFTDADLQSLIASFA